MSVGVEARHDESHRADLADTPFIHLLVSLADGRHSGTLEVGEQAGAPPDVCVGFAEGVPVQAQCQSPAGGLPQVLIGLCARPTGHARFIDGDNMLRPGMHPVTGRVDPVGLIVLAMRGSMRQDAVARAISAMGDGELFVRSRVDLDRYSLTPAERTLAEQLKVAPATLEQLQAQATLPWAQVCALVYVLRVTHALTVRSPRTYSGTIAHQSPLAVGPGPAATTRYHVRDPSHGQESVPASPHAPGAALPADLPHGLRLWAEEILQRYRRLERQTHYDILEVERSAGAQQVQRAFVTLSKRFHPDQLPEPLSPLRDACATILGYLTEAHDTLSDPERREVYRREVEAGGGTPATAPRVQRAIDADVHHQKAELLFKSGVYRDALAEAHRALELDDTRPRYHALFGYLLHRCADREGEVAARVWHHLDRALGEDPRCALAHHLHALLLKETGEREGALHHFRRALELDPENLEAAREVRIAAIREERRRRWKRSRSLKLGKG